MPKQKFDNKGINRLPYLTSDNFKGKTTKNITNERREWRITLRGREKLLRNSNNYCFRIARITFIIAGFFDIFQEFPTFIEAAINEATHSVYDVRSSFD